MKIFDTRLGEVDVLVPLTTSQPHPLQITHFPLSLFLIPILFNLPPTSTTPPFIFLSLCNPQNKVTKASFIFSFFFFSFPQTQRAITRNQMAQKTEKEETEFKVPETITPCVDNCGITGNTATNNVCQNCFNATTTTTTGISQAYECVWFNFLEKIF